MEDHLEGFVTYSGMTLNMDFLKGIEITLPSTQFNIFHDDNGYHIHYIEANESFNGFSMENVIEQLTAFLQSDQVIEKVGTPFITLSEGEIENA